MYNTNATAIFFENSVTLLPEKKAGTTQFGTLLKAQKAKSFKYAYVQILKKLINLSTFQFFGIETLNFFPPKGPPFDFFDI